MQNILTHIMLHNKIKIINKDCLKNNNQNFTFNEMPEDLKKQIIISYSNSYIKAKNNKDIELFSEKVKYFLITMYSKCPNFNSNIFIKNMKKTIIDIKDIMSYKDNLHGHFYKTNNKHDFYINSFEIINHELFHMTQFNNHFSKKVINLNEGYTQLLAERYFFENVGKSYIFEVLFMQMIENTLGQDNLEKLYFNGDFPDKIIDLLSEYLSIEEIDEFIEKLELISKFDCATTEELNENAKKIDELFNSLFSIINNIIINKINSINDINEVEKLQINGNITLNTSINDKPSYYNIEYDNRELISKVMEEKNKKGINL